MILSESARQEITKQPVKERILKICTLIRPIQLRKQNGNCDIMKVRYAEKNGYCDQQKGVS